MILKIWCSLYLCISGYFSPEIIENWSGIVRIHHLSFSHRSGKSCPKVWKLSLLWKSTKNIIRHARVISTYPCQLRITNVHRRITIVHPSHFSSLRLESFVFATAFHIKILSLLRLWKSIHHKQKTEDTQNNSPRVCGPSQRLVTFQTFDHNDKTKWNRGVWSLVGV